MHRLRLRPLAQRPAQHLEEHVLRASAVTDQLVLDIAFAQPAGASVQELL